MGVYSRSLNPLQQLEALQTDRLPTAEEDWAFRMADMVPFGASWTFERVSCRTNRHGGMDDYVRVFVK